MKFTLTSAALTLMFCLAGCSASVTTNSSTTTANTTKTASSNTAANSNAATSNKAAPPKPSTTLKSEKDQRPTSGTKTAKKVEVPENWIYLADEVKGYGFWMPDGSVGDTASEGGMDTFVAQTPSPTDVNVTVFAWKDKTLSKDDLLKMAVDTMQNMGEKVTPGALTEINADYDIAEATSVDSAGKKWKMKILVGTDVTDNYVMIVASPEDKYQANIDVIDTIWGNFEMYSGGASGNS